MTPLYYNSFWFKIAFGILPLLLIDYYLINSNTSVPYVTKHKFFRFQLTVILEIILFLISKYFWKRLVVDMTNSLKGSLQFMWKLVVIGFLILSHFAPFTYFLISKEPSFFNMLPWYCFGIYIQLALIFCILQNVVWKLCQFFNLSIFNIDVQKQSIIAVIIILVLSLIQINIATSPPTIVRVNVSIAKLPNSMNNFRIAFLADIHVGPTLGFSKVDRIVQITNDLNPDLIVFGGDLTDATVNDADGSALPLKDLKAPFGKFFVTGNHDYYTGDVNKWFDLVTEYGFTVLHNSNKKIYSTSKEDWFCLIGTDDIEAKLVNYLDHGMDLDKAYTGCDEEHASILIAHQPKAAKQAIDSKYSIQLVLSGHTHGGQIYPFRLLAFFMNPFLNGLYPYKESYVYVTQGSSYYAFPFRHGSFPEITEITFKTIENK